MAKGNKKIDRGVISLVREFTDNITQTKTLRNLDQKTIREVKRDLAIVIAHLDYYQDVRNEQGRGGK